MKGTALLLDICMQNVYYLYYKNRLADYGRDYSMAIKCDYKISGNAMQISAPRGLDLLPGRLIRKIVKNIESKYQICEYSEVKGRKEAEMMDDVVGSIYLKGGIGAWLFGNTPIAVFQRIHTSLYDPDFLRLEDEETMEFQNRLPDDEPFNYEDFTVSMPSDYHIMIAPSTSKLIEVVSHLRPDNFDDVRKAISRIAVASITVYDEADMYIEYTDKEFPIVFAQGVDEWLNEPQEVEYLDF